jgi:hypothetical protein
VSSQRTGSSFLHDYVLNKNDGFGLYEFFLDYRDLKDFVSGDNAWWHDMLRYTFEEKFEFLERCKKENVYVPWKTFPSQILNKDKSYENRLYNLLDGYKILAIDRDPWDTFLSYSYQDYINWKSCHRYYDTEIRDFIELESFSINLNKIKWFCDTWKINSNFIKKLDIHHIFKYEDLTINNLQEYFQTSYEGKTTPIDIDYRNIAVNIKEAKEMFDYEMYGAGNRYNN